MMKYNIWQVKYITLFKKKYLFITYLSLRLLKNQTSFSKMMYKSYTLDEKVLDSSCMHSNS